MVKSSFSTASIKLGAPLLAVGIFLATSGCANNPPPRTASVNHYSRRTTQLGSNIPQPYAAGADDNGQSAGQADFMNTAERQSNTPSSMQGAQIGGGAVGGH